MLSPKQAHAFLHTGALGRVFGLLLPTQVHSSFEYVHWESPLIELRSLPCPPPAVCTVPNALPFLLPSLPTHQCANAGSLVCVPVLAHWCVCTVCTCVLIEPPPPYCCKHCCLLFVLWPAPNRRPPILPRPAPHSPIFPRLSPCQSPPIPTASNSLMDSFSHG